MAGWLNDKQIDKSLLLLFLRNEDSSFCKKEAKNFYQFAFALCG
jgi:hypothetical protein